MTSSTRMQVREPHDRDQPSVHTRSRESWTNAAKAHLHWRHILIGALVLTTIGASTLAYFHLKRTDTINQPLDARSQPIPPASLQIGVENPGDLEPRDRHQTARLSVQRSSIIDAKQAIVSREPLTERFAGQDWLASPFSDIPLFWSDQAVVTASFENTNERELTSAAEETPRSTPVAIPIPRPEELRITSALVVPTPRPMVLRPQRVEPDTRAIPSPDPTKRSGLQASVAPSVDLKPRATGTLMKLLGFAKIEPNDDFRAPRGLSGLRRTDVAIYDIGASTVYLPDGETLEAHSGIGDMRDNPAFANRSNKGPTPPHTYQLSLRESPYHGVEAIRLTPVNGDDAVFGRNGLFAHTYMLGKDGDSHGCVVFKDYRKFLTVFKSGMVKQMVVVPRLQGPPSSVFASVLVSKD